MAKQTKPDPTSANAMADALFSSFTQPPSAPAVTPPAPAASPLSTPTVIEGPRTPPISHAATPVPEATPAASTIGTPVPSAGATVGRALPPRRNRAAPEAKRRRETVILSEAERRPIVQVAEHMAATKPGSSFSEAARFLLAIGEHVLATRPDAYAQLERTPPAGWSSLARALATSRDV